MRAYRGKIMENVIYCDGNQPGSIDRGLAEALDEIFTVKCSNASSGKTNFYRYMSYFLYPIIIFFTRKKYKIIIGWQQFFALIFVFYCELFKVKKKNFCVALNYTYKEKNGLIGFVYECFMKKCLNSRYLDYVHIPSYNYVKYCKEVLGADENKFIVAPFGVQDRYEQFKNSKVNYENYVLSIGRSNRDFKFLIEAWREINYPLLIICDTLKIDEKLPSHIKILNNVLSENQFPYLMNSDFIIIPILDGAICSGDTVLLTGMSFCKTMIVTKPSTLQEMYINDGIDGIAIEKDIIVFREKIFHLLNNKELLTEIGENARSKYLQKYSIYTMGKAIGEILKQKGI